MWYVWIGIITFLAGIFIAIYFWRKEKKTTGQIQKMLDSVIAGRAVDVQLNESKAAAIENDMWRYLCGKEAFEQNIRCRYSQKYLIFPIRLLYRFQTLSYIHSWQKNN